MANIGGGRKWTSKDDQHLVKRWEAGDSQDQIGRLLGVSKNTIAGRVMRLRSQGVDIPRRQGGDPALKQKMRRRQNKEAVTRNAKVNPRVKKELERQQARTLMRKRAHPSEIVTPDLPMVEDTPDIHLGSNPGEAFANNYRGIIPKEKPAHATAPKVDAIPEVIGTTCTTLLNDLKRGQCRYVHGFGAGKRFCDGVAVPGKSMCEAHHDLCYRSTARQFDKASFRVAR